MIILMYYFIMIIILYLLLKIEIENNISLSYYAMITRGICIKWVHDYKEVMLCIILSCIRLDQNMHASIFCKHEHHLRGNHNITLLLSYCLIFIISFSIII